MTDRPIIYSGAMVTAQLDGSKTQTRRILKPQPPEWTQYCAFNIVLGWSAYAGHWTTGQREDIEHSVKFWPGDRLWVKETWRTESRAFDHLAPSEMRGEETILYDADTNWSRNKTVGKARASIHMPKWASRITNVVTGVKIERLQDISEADAIAEGAPLDPHHIDGTQDGSNQHMVAVNAWTKISPVAWYHRLWEHINGPGSWDANPWVVAVTFEVHRKNIMDMAA